MANATTLPGDLIVSGDIRLSGKISPQIAKANILALAKAQPFVIKLTDFRVWDAMQTLLPGTPTTDDLGLIGGTWATNTPSIRSEDLKALGATTKRARVQVQIPWEYQSGEAIAIRFKAGMITTVAGTSATIDCEAFKQQADPDDAMGSDLVTTNATTMNSLVFSDIDFSLNPSTLSPGDMLDVRVTIVVTDGASGTAVIAGITSAKLLCDVR